ncbi:MAG TPA: hypothetical protein VFW75_01350 [Acetobacteraceae bacterium]|nr:hypothetical protein [Acetobacteraceae bacterium]
MLMQVNDTGPWLFDPRGVVESRATPIAPRPPRLDGLRLGVLDNSKWNANKLLRGTVAALVELIRFSTTSYHVKHSFSKDAAPELIEQLAAESDLVLTAIGDCGSCCSACLRDAIALEKLGIPSATAICWRSSRAFWRQSHCSPHGRSSIAPTPRSADTSSAPSLRWCCARSCSTG